MYIPLDLFNNIFNYIDNKFLFKYRVLGKNFNIFLNNILEIKYNNFLINDVDKLSKKIFEFIKIIKLNLNKKNLDIFNNIINFEIDNLFFIIQNNNLHKKESLIITKIIMLMYSFYDNNDFIDKFYYSINDLYYGDLYLSCRCDLQHYKMKPKILEYLYDKILLNKKELDLCINNNIVNKSKEFLHTVYASSIYFFVKKNYILSIEYIKIYIKNFNLIENDYNQNFLEILMFHKLLILIDKIFLKLKLNIKIYNKYKFIKY